MVEDSQSGVCPVHSAQELAQFSDDMLSPRRQRRLQQHLQECTICRRQLEELAAVRALLKEAPTPLPPRDFALSAGAAQRYRHRLWYPGLRAATAVAAVLVLVIFLGSMVQPHAPAVIPATSRPLGQKPSPLVEPTPKSVAVAPAITRRAPPTGSSHSELTMAPPTVTLSISGETGYPAPPTPWIYVTVSRVLPQPGEEPQPIQPANSGAWDTLKVGGLLLLGLFVGLTWVAFRRERMFFL